jgi:DHA2 family multidrug resistance protein
MIIGFTYFIAHTALSRPERAFLDYRLLKNGNYVTGLLFIFIVGSVLFGSRALLFIKKPSRAGVQIDPHAVMD